jgi:hypothetical protein
MSALVTFTYHGLTRSTYVNQLPPPHFARSASSNSELTINSTFSDLSYTTLQDATLNEAANIDPASHVHITVMFVMPVLRNGITKI